MRRPILRTNLLRPVAVRGGHARRDASTYGRWAMVFFACPEMLRPLDDLRPLRPAPGHLSEATFTHYTSRAATWEGRILRVNHPSPAACSRMAHRLRVDQCATLTQRPAEADDLPRPALYDTGVRHEIRNHSIAQGLPS